MGKLKESDIEPDVGPFYYYLNYYFELGTCREPGSPISWLAIKQFFDCNNEDDFEEFLYIIRVLDNEYLAFCEKERSKDDRSSKKN